MGIIPNLIDPRMLSQVGETPPLQDSITPVSLPAPPPAAPMAPMAPPPDLPVPGGPPLPQRPAPPGFAQVLVKSIPLLLAGLAARRGGPPAVSGLLGGYTDSLERRRLLEEKQYEFDVQTAASEDARQARISEQQANRQARIGNYVTDLLGKIAAIDDPAQYAAVIQTADEAAQRAFGTPKGFISKQLAGGFDKTKALTKGQKDAQARLAVVRTQLGEDGFNDAVASNATITDPATGKRQSLRELQALAGLDVTGPDGEPIGGTPAIPTDEKTAITSAVRAAQAEARRSGVALTPEKLRDVATKARTEWAAAGRPPDSLQHGTIMKDGQLVQANFDPKTGVWTPAKDPETGKYVLAPPSQTLINLNAANSPPKPILPGTPDYVVAQKLAFGQMTSQFFRTLVAYTKDTQKKFALFALASEINPNFNEADFNRGYKFISTPRIGMQLASLDNALSGVPDLLAASDEADRFGSPTVNKFYRPVKVAMGGQNFSNLEVARKAWADEVSGGLGFGTASDMKLELGLDLTDANLSPANFRSAIQTIVVPFLERKRDSILRQASVYGRPDNNSSVNEPPPPPGAAGATGRGTGAGPAAGGAPPPKTTPTVTINGKSVTGPTGSVYTYPSVEAAQAAAAALKAAYGIK